MTVLSRLFGRTAAPTGALLFDATGPIDPAAVKAAGISGAMRYFAQPGSKKIIHRAELDSYLNAGLEVGFVYETTADRTLSGFAAGSYDARAANIMGDGLGVPATIPIFFATDFQPVGGQMSAVHAYYQGATAASPRPVGVYGGVDTINTVMAAGYARYGWQTQAWSSGRVSPYACLLQHARAVRNIPGHAIDTNVVLKADHGVWSLAAPPIPDPHPGPDPGGFLMALTADEQKQVLSAAATAAWNATVVANAIKDVDGKGPYLPRFRENLANTQAELEVLRSDVEQIKSDVAHIIKLLTPVVVPPPAP